MMINRKTLNLRGATLVETLIAAAVASLILGTIAIGAITLKRTFILANRYSQATSEEMLVMDWISSDLRAAIGASVTTVGPNQMLTLTMPGYLDATRQPRMPVVASGAPKFGNVTGTVDYGDPNAFPTVVYSVSAGRLLRQAGGQTAVLSSSLKNFQLNCLDQGDRADVRVSFDSAFAPGNQANAAAATTLRTVIYNRNSRRL